MAFMQIYFICIFYYKIIITIINLHIIKIKLKSIEYFYTLLIGKNT